MILEKIREWFAQGAWDFDTGFELLHGQLKNRFYLDNIRRRRDLASVKHELDKAYYSLGGRKEDRLKRLDNEAFKKPDEKGSVDDVSLAKGGSQTEGITVRGDEPTVIEGSNVLHEDRVGPRDERLVLRKEFPFLDAPGCPEEFKILVADMITAHGRYVRGHDRLYDVAHRDERVCYKAAREVVENYIDNRAMWEELEHYKRTGDILGRHRVFRDRKLREQIVSMSEEELKKYLANLKRKRIAREKLMAENAGDERYGKWMAEIEEIAREEKMIASWGVNVLLIRKKKRGRKSKK